MKSKIILLSLVCLSVVGTIVNASTSVRSLPSISFNSDMIHSSLQENIDMNNRDELIKIILREKSEGIFVYPSEGYYYFEFMNGSTPVKGNFRFDIKFRNQGQVAFTYYDDSPGVQDSDNYWVLGRKDGLILHKISDFQYQLSFQGESVPVFIYDAKKELSAQKNLGETEEYVGPLFDESGIRFHLVFDQSNNSFLYVLNENYGQPEQYVRVNNQDSLLIGTRSKFAYYNDRINNRRVLIGVDLKNSQENSYYDGPFDQLPDSFVDPVHLKDLIERYEPRVMGKIGPFGDFLDEDETRYAIMPYIEYSSKKQLLKYLNCAQYTRRDQLNYCLSHRAKKPAI